jgi:maltose-binding protein MalE
MRKLMLLAAILAMALVAVAPAIAQVSQEDEQDTESGDLNQSVNITGGGDNSNQCANVQEAGNTGNTQSQIPIIQYASTADDFEFEDVGSTITVSPTNTTDCTQAVNQAASASG